MLKILVTSSNSEWDVIKRLLSERFGQSNINQIVENGICSIKVSDNLVAINGGMGTINAASTLEYALNKYGTYIDSKDTDSKDQIKIIVAGIAGSIDPILELGDIVIVEKYINLFTDHNVIIQSPPFKKAYYSDPDLINRAKKLAIEINKKAPAGYVGTSNFFINTPEEVDEAKTQSYDTASDEAITISGTVNIVDMESAAYAQIAARHNVPILTLRSISDKCATSYSEFDKQIVNLEAQAARAISFALDFIDTLS
jgi:nucleoside phosphorylase